MFEDIMCLMAGFITAYLIIKAVRSFRGGVGVLLLLLSAAAVRAATVPVVVNYSGFPGAGYQITTQITVGCGADHSQPGQNFVDSTTGASGQFTRNFDTGNCASRPCVYVQVVANGANTLGVAWCPSGTTLAINYNGGQGQNGVVTNTDAVVCVSGWTNRQSCCVSLALMATNSTLHLHYDSLPTAQICPGSVMPAFCMTNLVGTDGQGNGIGFSVTIWRSGCLEDDYIPVILSGGDSGPLPRGGGGGVPGPTKPPKDDRPPPDSPYDTNKTGDQVLHNDLAQLIRVVAKDSTLAGVGKSVDETADLLDYDLESVKDAINNTTNYMGGGLSLDELRRIKTNTAGILSQGHADAMGLSAGLIGYAATNAQGEVIRDAAGNPIHIPGVLDLIYSNGLPVTSTQVVGMFDSTGTIAGIVGVVTNRYGSNWTASGMGRLTNGYTKWGTNVTQPFDDPMVVSHPSGGGGIMGLVMSFSILRQRGLLQDDFVAAGPWIRKWIAWGVTLALWWLCVARCDEAVTSVAKVAAVSAKPSGGVVDAYLLRGTVGLMIALAITTAMATLPTAAIAWLETEGITGWAPWSGGQGFASDIVNVGASHFVAIMQEYWSILVVFVPLNVIFLAIVSWAVFFFTVQFWFGLVCTALRVMGMMIPALLFCALAVECRADVVRFENLSGNQVVASNGVEVLSFPVGTTDKLVLHPGNWICGTNGFTVSSGGFQVVRAVGDTNMLGGMVFIQADGYSGYGWFMWGMNCGFVVFGTAWVVSCARSGILLRVRE